MLERLRNVKAMITTELEDEHDQRDRYADAAFEALGHAAMAGAQFARDEGGVTGPGVAKRADRGLRGRPRGDHRVGACASGSSLTAAATVPTA